MKKILLENAGNQVEITEAQLSEEKAKAQKEGSIIKVIKEDNDSVTYKILKKIQG